MSKFGKIYTIKNDVNDKLYIGFTRGTLENRMKWHYKAFVKTGSERRDLYRAMKLYGFEKFRIELLDNYVYMKDIHQLEVDYIKQYDSFYNGYNSSKGGEGKINHIYFDTKDAYQKFKAGESVCRMAERIGVGMEEVFKVILMEEEKRRD